ncbi:MAG: hypothetical protein JNK46_00735 [Methylobacteriaceae bacterium]|nr:hypothetical protein [Methylobacteriaceae bacterium]
MTKTTTTLLAAAFAAALFGAPAQAEQNDSRQVMSQSIEAPVTYAPVAAKTDRASGWTGDDRFARDNAGAR